MAEATGAVQILLDLDTHDANEFLLEPALNYDNVLQNRMGIYKVKTGVKNKWRMTHLNKPKNSLQPKRSCKEWRPTVNFDLRPDEIGTCSFEVMGEQCGDEFDEGCARNLQAAENAVNRMDGTPELDAIQMAMVLQLRTGIVDDTYKTAWFGDIDFNTEDGDWEADLENWDSKEEDKITDMLRHCNGWWSEIIARASSSDAKTKINWIDSNDGSGNGNATQPGNIVGFLRDLRNNAHPILQFWNMNRPSQDWPVYLLQKELFDAYITYLQSTGCEENCKLRVEGIPVPGVYMFEGYPVMMVPEWTMFDYEIGALNNGKSKHARALFTAKENLCLAADADSIQGRPGSTLAIEAPTRIKDKGATFMYAHYKFGFGIAHNHLMVASWNSSTSFAA